MAEEVKNPTNWGQGLGGVSIAALAAVELGKGILNHTSGSNAATQAANTAVAMELAQANSKIAMLEQNAATRNALTDTLYKLDTRVGKLETETPLLHKILEQKVDSVATIASNGIAANGAAIANLAATVNSITKCVVPNSAICPGWGNVTITPATTGTAVTA